MKIELEEKDKCYIKKVTEGLANGEDVPLWINKKGGTYYINFTCVDIAKANAFIGTLFGHANAYDNYLEDNLGITLNSLNYCNGDNKLSELKAMLQKILTDIEYMEKR